MDKLLEVIKTHGFEKLFNILSYEAYWDLLKQKEQPLQIMQELNDKDPVLAACLTMFNTYTIYVSFLTLIQMYKEHLKTLGLNDEDSKEIAEAIIIGVISFANKHAEKIGLHYNNGIEHCLTLIGSCGLFKNVTIEPKITEGFIEEFLGGGEIKTETQEVTDDKDKLSIFG